MGSEDSDGNQVVPGKYDVTAEYSNKDPSSERSGSKR